MRRVVLAAMVGTTIEWYDYFLYGTAAATVFNKLFFPGFSPTAGTLASLSTFAVGFPRPSPPTTPNRGASRRSISCGRSARSSSGTSATGSAARPR
jgi:hypothetical protein